VRIYGVVEWTTTANSAAVSGIQIDRADAACGTPVKFLETRAISFRDRTILLPCTVQLRLVIGAGLSPPASVTFW
jgi:hypothetical protein